MSKTAIIIGITGQDGAYLSRLLLGKGYRVIGAVRRSSTLTLPRLAEMRVIDDIDLRTLDIQELPNICRLLEETGAEEIYNLGAQSSVQVSFAQPIYTAETAGLGTIRLLEAIRLTGGQARLFQASSSEIFGRAQEGMVTEATPMQPRSPYGVAKLLAHWSLVNYREAHGLFSCSGLMFNHESPYRGLEFVTRKITANLALMACGGQKILRLGNLDARRDWSFAGDMVQAMWLMLQHDQPDDYVVASGITHAVRDWVNAAASCLGFDIQWEGEGVNERGFDRVSGRELVAIDKNFFRPSEPEALAGNAARARDRLGWSQHVNFETLVEMMAKSDYDRAKSGGGWF